MKPNLERAFRFVDGVFESIRRRIVSRFEVDTRSLAAVRIALGAAILIDLFHRAGSLELFYTAEGVYPIAVHEAVHGQAGLVSIHALSGGYWFQAALFVLAGAFAIAFVVGYRTRLVGVISLVFLLSLHIRNPMVLNGGDRLLRVMLLVALLTPLGERWSIDALRRGETQNTVTSVGTAALLLQPLAVFTSNAIQKRGGEHWYSGDAVELALYDPTMATGFGRLLLDAPALLSLFTYGWVILLAGAIPFLLLSTGRIRALAVSVYLAAFAGMAISMSVGLFPLVLAASVLPFLPGGVWDRLTRWVPNIEPRNKRPGSVLPTPSPEDGCQTPVRTNAFDPSGSRFTVITQPALMIFNVITRSAVTILAVFVLTWILLFTAFDVTAASPPPPLDSEHLDQQDWGLYAPDPSATYSWYVTTATLEDGSQVDVRNDGPVSFDRPPDAHTYGSFRYRGFMLSLDASDNDMVAERYAQWMCEEASTRSGSVDRVSVYRIHQSKPLDGDYAESRRSKIIERGC